VQLTWSTGQHDLPAAAQLDSEQSDEELGDEDLEGECGRTGAPAHYAIRR
jgi:hypothetical protein